MNPRPEPALRSPNSVTRREALKASVIVGLAATISSTARGQAPAAATPERTFYYVDGYHGGVDGHMPPDSLRNVLDGLDKFPNWKVSFEIEPYSWAAFAKSDPASIERLGKFLADQSPAGRVELISGAYGQGYAWNGSGESNIRQLAYGLAELRAVFPDLVVDTYAAQEPCWTSCLPGLLKSFGYRRAVLKSSTCWGGYHAATVDADLVNWVGPERTGIPTVPRYALEKLVPPATEENAQPTADFIDRCLAVGIKHPAGTILQDMGWPGRPWRFGIRDEVVRAMKHVTWREYVDTIADAATKEWKATQDDLRVGLPWGGSILQRIAQVVRAGENQLVQAEKLASMALVRRGLAFPTAAFDQAWKHVLWSQHHDAWIVSYNRHKEGTWASAVDAKFEDVERACKQIVRDAAASLASRPQGGEAKAAKGAERHVRVFNTTGFRRTDVASIELQAEAGKQFEVVGGDGKPVPSQLVSADGGAGKAVLLFDADVPSMGYSSYTVQAVDVPTAKAARSASASTASDGTVSVETDLYKLSFDPAKGGRIVSLYSKALHREFVDKASPHGLNEFRGHFPEEGKWLSSADGPAEVTVVEGGPLRVTVRVSGRIGAWPFTSVVSLVAGRARIDFETSFDFPVDSSPFGRGRGPRPATQPERRFRVGEPWERGRDTMRSNRRPFYDSSYKLQALFPHSLRQPTVFKNAPFDVCESKAHDTRFDAWDNIKNNVVLNWVDLLEEGGAAGLAVMTDHVTAYHLAPDAPLGLVACYAGLGVWHDYALGRTPRLAYAVIPHAGDWAAARLWREQARWSEPLVTEDGGPSSNGDAHWSLIDATDSGLEVVTAYRDGEHLLIRFFNADGDAKPRRVAIAKTIRRAHWIELDGRVIGDVPIEWVEDGPGTATAAMKRFEIRTMRCEIG